ncbi:hypothetical protein QFC20_006284 [Naganishia adeliensis]|uniref:Uncharacterized protein n=1 Tax=Naganishia adeliensis TaxID=92952 RepID=A0ACC2VCL4_9TREE|nr:hypothetical protein QFC20_006284 [Naganishia adeliensis]
MSGYAFVDADDDFGGDVARTGKPAAGDGLQFQNFLSADDPHADTGRASPSNRVASDAPITTAPHSFFNLTYYQTYFDITTPTLFTRLTQSLIPRPEFLSSVCGDQVDLYGPFWTLTTLIFTIYLSTSLSASISSYLSHSEKQTQDLTLLSAATTLIYTYGLAFPALIWAASRWFSRTGGNGYTQDGQGVLGAPRGEGVVEWRLVDALAIWGYSMVVYVPVSILCVIPIPILRWILVGGAAISSGYFLWLNVYPILAGPDNKNLRLLTILIVLVHAGVALTMKVLFFSYSVGGKLIGPNDPLGGGIGGGVNTDVDGVLDSI